MKIAVVTMNVKAGKCQENYEAMEKYIMRAIEDKANIIVFPQNCISGYHLGDLWLDDAWCQYVDHFNDKIMEYSDRIAIVWGNIKYRSKKRFNAAIFAYKGTTHIRIKQNENHFVYQDSRYFSENAIHSAVEYEDQVYALNFKDEIQIADMNFNLDARPFCMDDNLHIKGSCVYVNAVGMQIIGKSVLPLQGGSKVVIENKLLYQAPYFQEEYALVDTTSSHIVKETKPILMDALCMTIQAFDEQVLQGKRPWIIGLSGGLDSSVTAALLVKALGKERVIGYNLATQYNTHKTIDNAKALANRLGIAYKEGSIETLVEGSIQVLEKEYDYDAQKWNNLVKENIQARIRGHLLSSFAQIHGGVVVNNANKVELALGYCTLYGDAIGALSILGDITKVQLFTLARELNETFGCEVIANRLLPTIENDEVQWEMPPSAELRDDQFDPMKWFYHDYLVEHLGKDMTLQTLMQKYIDKSIFDTEIGPWIKYYGLDQPKAFIEDLDWFCRTMQNNGFKRLQTPPLIVVSSNAYGNSKVEAQITYDEGEYHRLKEQILQLG